jgi:hypothetical protein
MDEDGLDGCEDVYERGKSVKFKCVNSVFSFSLFLQPSVSTLDPELVYLLPASA